MASLKRFKDDVKEVNVNYECGISLNGNDDIKVGDITVAANTATDTVTFVAGSNITITPDTTNDTITITAVASSDTKVTNTLNTTTKAYITGTTSASTNTGTQVFDTGVYLDTTAGMLTATTFNGKLTGNADSATKLVTARNINGVSFDGSSDISINTTEFVTYTYADIPQ